MQDTKLISHETELNPAETVQLCQLSESIDWLALEKEIIPILGSHSGPIVRLVCGAIYLQSFYELPFAEVIEKWPHCPEYRQFCGGGTEDVMACPITLQTLNMLANKLEGKGYDAMINALPEAPNSATGTLQKQTYREPTPMNLTSFDGDTIMITGSGGSSENDDTLTHASGKETNQTINIDEWWNRCVHEA